MNPTTQLLLGIGAFLVSLIGLMTTILGLNRQKTTLIYDLKEKLAVLESRINGFNMVSERWLASMLKAPTHQRMDTLLDKFTNQEAMDEQEYEELEWILDEQVHTPERFSGQRIALGFMKAFVMQRRLLQYPPPPPPGQQQETRPPWWKRAFRWLF